jgi:pimeloyl-ACP methyl ester carboxylesterase
MTIEQQEVKPYEHPEKGIGETELHQFRAAQLAFRSQEVSATLDLLEAINSGHAPANLWTPHHPSRAAGLEDVLDSLKSRLSFDWTVMMGHSFGAATGFLSASRDSRIKSVVAMDPWMYPMPSQFAHTTQHPLLVINSEKFHWKTNMDSLKQLLQHNVSLGAGAPSSHASMMVTLRGTGHMDQSDLTVALPSYLTSRFRSGQTADPVAVLRSNNDIILAFLKEKAKVDMPSDVQTLVLPSSEEERLAFEAKQSCIVDYM